MAKELVKVYRKEPRASTWLLKDGFGFEHRYLVETIGRFREDFDSLGVIPTQSEKPTSKDGGRPIKHYLLNEAQCLYLGTLFRNTAKVRKFKLDLVKEFTRMKKALSNIAVNQKNEAWLEKRERGKVSRLEETDEIKIYVEYAKANGSKNAKRYYGNISKMENKALFFLEQKFPNVRDALEGHQLETIANADKIVARQLKRCVDESIDYHEGYYMAKRAVEAFSELIGKSLVPSLELIPEEDKHV